MKWRLFSYLLVLLLCISIKTAYAEWSSVGTGIDYQQFTLPYPNNVFVARHTRSNTNAFIESSIAQGRTSGGTETVSNQASRYDEAINYWNQTWGNRNDVIVAINGSYYNTTTGVPESGVIHSSWYDKRYDNASGMSGFLWQLDRDAFIGECITHFNYKNIVTYVNTTNTQQFQGVGRDRGSNELIIYTPQYDSDTNTDNTGSEVLVELSTRPALIIPTPNMVTGYVRQIREDQGSTPIPFDHIVLSATGTAETTMLSNVSIGSEIGISHEIKSYERDCSTARSLDWTKTYAGVSGNWVFLNNNVIQYGIDPSGETHPRTAIALNDSYVFYIVCDGRDPGTSVGMTIDELAEFCKNTLGATWGVNQDGGGSSTMVVNGTVMNNPSDGSERSVANGMLMCNLLAKSQTTTFAADDPVQTNAAANIRLGPGTNYAVITTLSSGATGTIVAHSLNGVAAKGYNWWKCDFSGTVGWVAESLLEPYGPPITCHVDSIVLSTVPGSKGTKYGRATVTIKDNNGGLVSSANVTGTFTGDFDETLSETTNINGVAVLTTTAAVKKPSFTFCVDNITHASLTYNSDDNVETCYSY
ncbi:MAG: phosphodiester glycosidase family protein [Planctomycetota bacterium]|nr:MAG: phosphodiester glycosidase family protein [Planctomycetota bacterium]